VADAVADAVAEQQAEQQLMQALPLVQPRLQALPDEEECSSGVGAASAPGSYEAELWARYEASQDAHVHSAPESAALVFLRRLARSPRCFADVGQSGVDAAADLLHFRAAVVVAPAAEACATAVPEAVDGEAVPSWLPPRERAEQRTIGKLSIVDAALRTLRLVALVHSLGRSGPQPPRRRGAARWQLRGADPHGGSASEEGPPAEQRVSDGGGGSAGDDDSDSDTGGAAAQAAGDDGMPPTKSGFRMCMVGCGLRFHNGISGGGGGMLGCCPLLRGAADPAGSAQMCDFLRKTR
jgi:hypothetical protein